LNPVLLYMRQGKQLQLPVWQHTRYVLLLLLFVVLLPGAFTAAAAAAARYTQ
jgi:hypothetical protein